MQDPTSSFVMLYHSSVPYNLQFLVWRGEPSKQIEWPPALRYCEEPDKNPFCEEPWVIWKPYIYYNVVKSPGSCSHCHIRLGKAKALSLVSQLRGVRVHRLILKLAIDSPFHSLSLFMYWFYRHIQGLQSFLYSTSILSNNWNFYTSYLLFSQRNIQLLFLASTVC